MKATVESLRLKLAGAPGVPDNELQSALDEALSVVEDEGFLEDHPRFDRLHKLYAAHLLEAAGTIEGPLSAKSVDGVSTSFAVRSSGGWLTEYRRAKVQIRGSARRIF